MARQLLSPGARVNHLPAGVRPAADFAPPLHTTQLVGRPVPDLCRHLGLTTGTLPSAAAAGPLAPAAGPTAPAAGPPAPAARTRKRAPPPPPPSEGSSSRKEGKHRDGRAAGGVNGTGVSAPARRKDCQVPSVAPPAAPPSSSAAAAGGGVAAGRGGGGVRAEEGQPVAARPAAVVLLPRRRIFYSSTFVRLG